MSRGRVLRVGVIGMGFMGRTHAAAFRRAGEAGFGCELVAACDRDARRLAESAAAAGNLATGAEGVDLTGVRIRDDPDEMIDDPGIDLVSICTHTDSHVELAIRALEAGKHVLVEKPVAVSAAEVRRLKEAAAGATTLCMPAMCMRFWPGWEWLRARAVDGSMGKVRSAALHRLGSAPGWSADFYRDPARSGGALVDLHVHDTDFLYWCFGRPESVCTHGTEEHFTTQYRYAAGPGHAAAEGAWDLDPGAGFTMRCTFVFERATADYELARASPLLLHRDGETEAVAVDGLSAYDAEIRHFVRAAAAEEKTALRATLDDAVVVAEILEAERESLRTGAPVAV